MNLSRLFRTALLSVLGLFVAGGLMAAQAQTVVVDEDDTPQSDETTISAGLTTLNNQVSDGTGTLVVFAGDYRDTDPVVDLGNANIPNITDLTFEVRRDDSDDTDQLTIQTLDLSGGGGSAVTDVTLQSTDGDGFMRIFANGGVGIGGTNFDLALQEGTLTLAEADVLQFQDPANASGASNDLNVYRTDGSDISGESPNYSGAISRLEYDADGADIAAGNELGGGTNISRVSTLAIDDANGTGNTHQVSFSLGSLSVSTFAHNAADNVRVDGDFSVDGNVSTGGDVTVTGTLSAAGDVTVNDVQDAQGNVVGVHELTVQGTLEIDGSSAPFLDADGSINPGSSGSASSAGNLSFTSTVDRSSTTGALVSIDGRSGSTGGSIVVFNNVSVDVTNTVDYTDNLITDANSGATLEIGGTLTVNPVTDGNTDSDTFTEDVDASLASTVTVSDVAVGSVADGSSNSDNTLVDLTDTGGNDASFTAGGQINAITVNDGGTTVNLTGGTTLTGQLDNLGNGTVTILGDVTYDRTSAAPILNSGSGTIAISSGATFTIDDSGDGDGGTNEIAANNNGSATDTGIRGSGTLSFTGDSGDTFNVTTNDSEPNNLTELVADAGVNVLDNTGALGTDSGTNAINLAGPLTANASVTLGDGATGNITVNGDVDGSAAVDFGGGGATGTVDITGTLTANSDIDFGPGATSGTVTITGDLVATSASGGSAADVDFRNASGANADPTADVVVEGNLDINPDPAGTFVRTANAFVQVQGNFTRAGDPNATYATNGSSTLELAGNSEVNLSPGSKFTLAGNLRIDKREGSATLTEALAVAGNVRVITDPSPSLPNNEFIIQENLFLSGSGNATFFLNSTVTTPADASGVPGFIIVNGSGVKTFRRTVQSSAIATLPVLPNLRVRGGTSNNVEISTDLEFSDTIELVDGGIQINSSSDFSPAGPGAQIIRELSNPTPSNTQITLANSSNDSFNGAGNSYDLTYTGDQASNVAREFSGNVADLTVAESSTPQLIEDEAITDTLTVEAGASIGDDGSAHTLTLSGSSVTHSVVGTISTGTPIEVDVTGQGATINGEVDPANPGANASRLEDLTVSASGVAVSDIHQVDGDLVVANGAGLTLGLADADNSGIDSDADGADDQTIAGSGSSDPTVSVSGNLTLATNVEVVSAKGSADDIAVTGSNGAINFDASNLILTNGGAQFNGDGNASYSSANGGRLVFNDQTAGANQQFGTADVAVPNVTVEDGVTLSENSAVSNDLQVNATISSGTGNSSDNLRFSGQGTLTASTAFTGDGELIANGTTLTTDVDASVSNFTIDSDTSTVTVNEDSDGTDDDLTVSNRFTLTDGTLDHATDIRLTGNTGSDEFLFEDDEQASIIATSGYIIFNSGPSGSNQGITASLDNPLTIPNLRVTGNGNTTGDTAGLAAGSSELTIGTELDLEEQFLTSSTSNGLTIAQGATIRRDVYTGSDVLDEKPSFTSYNLVYENQNSPDIQSGRELDDAPGTINNITIQGGADADFVGTALGGTVTVNGTLDIVSGTLNFLFSSSPDRQVEMANGALLRRTSSGSVLDQITAVNTYRLEYYGTGAVNASANEFLNSGGTVDSLGVNVSANGTNLLPSNRTVGAFTLSGGRTDLEDNNGNNARLTVNRKTTLNSGSLRFGTLDANGDILVEGATLASTTDVEGNTTVRNSGGVTGVVSGNFTTAGDFVFESGNLTSANLTFDGGPTQAFQLANPAVVTNLAIAQQGTDPQPAVNLTGDNLGVSNRITLSNGLLVIEDGQFLALSQTGATNGPFPGGMVGINPNTGRPRAGSSPAAVNRTASATSLSHVIGTVQQGVLAGTPAPSINPNGRYQWPVGSTVEYRPASITFTDDDPVDNATNIRIAHVNENPRGTGGLPIENAAVNSDGDSVNIGTYPKQYWQTSVTTGISNAQTFDLEFETGAEGFTDKFDGASELRIIRRFDGEASENDWELQGSPGSYNNALFRKDTDGDGTNESEFVSVRSGSSRGGLVPQGTRFTIGLPARMPRFLQALGNETVSEGDTLSGTFTASSQDLDQDVTLSLGDLPSGVDSSRVSFTSPPQGESVSDTTSGDFSFAPGFSGGNRTLTFTVEATDSDATADTSFTVTVNDVNRSPSFTQVLPDTTVEDGEQLTFTYAADDPDGDALGFSLADAPDGASIDTSSGEFNWTPSFSQAGGSYDVVTSVTDGDATVTSDTSTVTVEVSLARGDVDGDADTTQLDAAATLSIYLGTDNSGTPNVDESSPTAAQMFAADFNDNGNVNPFDASLILQEALGLNSGAVATASAKSSASAQGSVRLKGMDRKDNTATIPVVLSDGASGVQSVAVEVKIDPSIASVANVSTNLPEGWIADHSVQDGTITVGMAGTEAIGGGQIGKIQLKMSGDASVEPEGQFQLNAGAKQSLAVDVAPDKFALNGNYPNPVESSTTIEYSLKKDVHVEISVYDALGRKVSTVVDEQKSAGRFEATLDAGTLSSGVYFYRIQAGDFTATKKMTVIR